MGCLLAIISLAVPRVVLLVAFLATDWGKRAFDTPLWPILGFFLLPYTTLAYMAAMLNNNHAVTAGWLVLLIFAIVVDIGHWGGGHTYWRSSQR